MNSAAVPTVLSSVFPLVGTRVTLASPKEAEVLRKSLTIVLLIGLCLFLFLALNAAHFWLLPVTVVLYAALFDAVAAVVLVAALTLGLRRRPISMTLAEITLTFCVGFLIVVIYSIMVPTLIDRSLSIYMLEKVQQYGGGIKQQALEKVIKRDYFENRDVVIARLTEQLKSGTLSVKNGCVLLTPRGEFVVNLSQLYRKALLPKQREIIGAISSDLPAPAQASNPMRRMPANDLYPRGKAQRDENAAPRRSRATRGPWEGAGRWARLTEMRRHCLEP